METNELPVPKAPTSLYIPEANVPCLIEKIDKINRKAKRLGCVPVDLVVDEDDFIEIKREVLNEWGIPVRTIIIRKVSCTIDGVQPLVGGWTFIAVLERVEDENMVRCVPGAKVALPVRYRTADSWCDHCRTKRYRTETFVLHNAGEFKQVGRTCIGDFLGSHSLNPDLAIQMASCMLDAGDALSSSQDEDLIGGGGGYLRTSTLGYLSCVAAAIRTMGWMSRGNARKLHDVTATADSAFQIMNARGKELATLRAENKLPIEADVEMAEASLDWARNKFRAIPILERQEFEHSVAVAVKCDTLLDKASGVVAWVVAGYQKERQQLLEMKLKEAMYKTSTYIGTPGERIVFRAYSVGKRAFEGEYGTAYLYQLRTPEGCCVKWFSSSEREELEPSETLHTIQGTVKNHEVYQGTKQTNVNRCKILSAEDLAKIEAKAAKDAAKAAKKAAALAEVASSTAL